MTTAQVVEMSVTALSTTTVLFRTMFTQTIIFNLLMKDNIFANLL